jgi:hypothetical protein
MGPFDLYCAAEDDVLTEEECWRARGLQLPVHDEDGSWAEALERMRAGYEQGQPLVPPT